MGSFVGGIKSYFVLLPQRAEKAIESPDVVGVTEPKKERHWRRPKYLCVLAQMSKAYR